MTGVGLSFSFNNIYIGSRLKSEIESENSNLLLLQIAAKLQELLIIASLTTIIVHVARTELVFGDGLPLGLIGSGLLFSNLGYFVSSEFIGSIRYRSSLWRKARFLSMLVMAGILAAFSGPSTALLIVPRRQAVDAGGTDFYLPGQREDFWPDRVDVSACGDHPVCRSSNATQYAICPSAGYQALWAHFGQARLDDYQKSAASSPYSHRLSGSDYYWLTTSPLALLPRVFVLGDTRYMGGPTQGHTFLIQPHLLTTKLVDMLTTRRWGALTPTFNIHPDLVEDRLIRSSTIKPVTRVKCSAPQNVSGEVYAIQFPNVRAPLEWGQSIRVNTSFDKDRGAGKLQFQWVRLPLDTDFGVVTMGAIFEAP